MTDVGFVLAAYVVIIGGLGVYALALKRRLHRARARLEERRRDPRRSA